MIIWSVVIFITYAILLFLVFIEKSKNDELHKKLENSYKDYNKIIKIVNSYKSDTEIVNEILFEINNLPF